MLITKFVEKLTALYRFEEKFSDMVSIVFEGEKIIRPPGA